MNTVGWVILAISIIVIVIIIVIIMYFVLAGEDAKINDKYPDIPDFSPIDPAPAPIPMPAPPPITEDPPEEENGDEIGACDFTCAMIRNQVERWIRDKYNGDPGITFVRARVVAENRCEFIFANVPVNTPGAARRPYVKVYANYLQDPINCKNVQVTEISEA